MSSTTAPQPPAPNSPPSPIEPASSARLMPITPRPSNIMVRGYGSYLWDAGGARYLDFIQGWAVNSLGHAAPEIVSALADQAST